MLAGAPPCAACMPAHCTDAGARSSGVCGRNRLAKVGLPQLPRQAILGLGGGASLPPKRAPSSQSSAASVAHSWAPATPPPRPARARTEDYYIANPDNAVVTPDYAPGTAVTPDYTPGAAVVTPGYAPGAAVTPDYDPTELATTVTPDYEPAAVTLPFAPAAVTLPFTPAAAAPDYQPPDDGTLAGRRRRLSSQQADRDAAAAAAATTTASLGRRMLKARVAVEDRAAVGEEVGRALLEERRGAVGAEAKVGERIGGQ